MTLESADRILAAGARTIESLVSGMPDDRARWKPSPEAWSILEVVNHLYDEERSDFRARIQSTLADPQASWEPIDPDGWIKERDYNSRELGPSLENFLDERKKSIDWLQSEGKLDLDAAHVHPVIGALREGLEGQPNKYIVRVCNKALNDLEGTSNTVP